MPQVGFEYTIPVFERAKTAHALDREAAMIGSSRASRRLIWIWELEVHGSNPGCTKRKKGEIFIDVASEKDLSLIYLSSSK
jgi:hypothetical protein